MKKVKVGFVWHNVSSGNLGIGALSISNMILVKNAIESKGMECDFITIGDGGVTDPKNHEKVEGQIGLKFKHIPIMIKPILLNPLRLYDFYKLIRSFDLVLDIGAGDSFSDIYGFRRFFVQVFTKAFSASFAKYSVLSPQTIGPFKSKYAKAVAGYIINRTKGVFARDELSNSLGNELGDCNLATDVALSMPYEQSVKKSDETGKPTFGLNVSGLLWAGGYTKDNQFELAHSYKEFIIQLVGKIQENHPNVDIHLVPHVVTTMKSNVQEDDYFACKAVKDIFPDCILADRFTNPIDVKNYISRLDYFTGARMHATIAAFSSGVPVTPYAYSRKFDGLYGTLGYKKVLNAKDIPLERSIEIILDDFNNRSEISQLVSGCGNKIKRLTETYNQGLKDIINEITKKSNR